MIFMHQKVDPDSRTPNSGSAWIASASVTVPGSNDIVQARSRNGAPMALARALVRQGIEDQPVRVTTEGAAGHMDYPSLAKMAGQTISESAKRSVRAVKWSEFGQGVGKNVGEDPLEHA